MSVVFGQQVLNQFFQSFKLTEINLKEDVRGLLLVERWRNDYGLLSQSISYAFLFGIFRRSIAELTIDAGNVISQIQKYAVENQ